MAGPGADAPSRPLPLRRHDAAELEGRARPGRERVEATEEGEPPESSRSRRHRPRPLRIGPPYDGGASGPPYHTSGDVPELMDFDRLEQATRLLVAIMATAAELA